METDQKRIIELENRVKVLENLIYNLANNNENLFVDWSDNDGFVYRTPLWRYLDEHDDFQRYKK